MSWILVISLAFRLIAVGMSVLLWRRLKDNRIGFFTLMLVLMFGRQALTLVQSLVEDTDRILRLGASHVDELPGVLVSVMAVLAVHYLGRLIESRNRAEEESYQLSVAMRHAMSGVAWVDAQGQYTKVNLAYAKTFGYVPTDMVGQSWLSTVHHDDRREAQRGLEIMKSCGVSEIETRAIRHDGSCFDQSLLMVSPKDQEGKAKHAWYCCMRNVTKRKEAQRALHESERRYRLLFSRAPISIWEEDASRVGKWMYDLRIQGVEDLSAYLVAHPEAVAHAASLIRVVDVNDATVRMFEGTDKAEVMANLSSVLKRELYESFAQELLAMWEGRDRVEHPVSGTTLRGQVRHKIVHWTVPKIGGVLDLKRVVVVVSDITEHHRAQEELERYAHDLESANVALRQATTHAHAATVAKSEFLANMSHEIRTPLTAIMGYAELLSESVGLDNEDRESLDTIHRNGEHLLQVINDILDLSKIESGKMSLELVEVQLRRECDEAVTLLHGRAETKGLGLSIVYMPPVQDRIRTDPTRLRQILVNLIGNAIKFTDQGSIGIMVKPASNPLTREGIVCVDVKDTGVGLTTDQIGKLFRPFSQADSSTTRRFGGSGLGLTISRRIAVLLGGTISVHSRYGQGSTFTFMIATGQQEHHKIAGLEDAAAEIRSTPSSTPETTEQLYIRGRVLVGQIDREGERVADTVKQLGADVTIVDTGREAYQAIHDQAESGRPFDLVLMDMQIPDMNGYTVMKRLRSEGYRKPVVGLTEPAIVDDEERALWVGFTDQLVKPVSRQQLSGLVDKYLKATNDTVSKCNTVQGSSHGRHANSI